MDNNWFIVAILTALILAFYHDTITKLWSRFMLYLHVASGKQLFDYVVMYSPDDVPEEERVVKALIFSNDKEYTEKVLEVFEK